MKTAISIPDKLFRKADRFAKKLGMTRSRLYAEAVEKYLKESNGSDITKRLNEVYPGGKGSELDPAFKAAAMNALWEATKDDAW